MVSHDSRRQHLITLAEVGGVIIFYDMAVTLADIDDRDDFAALRQAFLTGYIWIQSLPPGYEAYIIPFSAARILLILQWLLERSHPEL